MPTYIDTVLKQFSREFGELYQAGGGGNGGAYLPQSAICTKEVKAFLKSSLEHFAQMVEDSRESHKYDLMKLHPSVDIAKRHVHNMTVDKIYDDIKSLLTPTRKE